MTSPRHPRLTPHQKQVLGRLDRLASHRPEGWVRAADIGSSAACDHLVAKGYVERRETTGPRGGVHYWYRPTSYLRFTNHD